jgi:hypothetical protein
VLRWLASYNFSMERELALARDLGIILGDSVKQAWLVGQRTVEMMIIASVVCWIAASLTKKG